MTLRRAIKLLLKLVYLKDHKSDVFNNTTTTKVTLFGYFLNNNRIINHLFQHNFVITSIHGGDDAIGIPLYLEYHKKKNV